jgi:hypothetical protein
MPGELDAACIGSYNEDKQYQILCCFTGQDVLVQHHAVLGEKRRVSYQHLVQEDAERPPVYRLAVTFVQNDLWSEVPGEGASLLEGSGIELRGKARTQVCRIESMSTMRAA